MPCASIKTFCQNGISRENVCAAFWLRNVQRGTRGRTLQFYSGGTSERRPLPEKISKKKFWPAAPPTASALLKGIGAARGSSAKGAGYLMMPEEKKDCCGPKKHYSTKDCVTLRPGEAGAEAYSRESRTKEMQVFFLL